MNQLKDRIWDEIDIDAENEVSKLVNVDIVLIVMNKVEQHVWDEFDNARDDLKTYIRDQFEGNL